jgi:hypothetical protein
MSARSDLVEALEAALPATYRVTGSPSCPDLIPPDTFDVRAWANKLTPGPASGSVQIDLTVWVLTPLQSPGPTDDALDVASNLILGILYELPWLSAPTAERGVMDDSDGPRWHGWKYDLTAYGQIQLEETTP